MIYNMQDFKPSEHIIALFDVLGVKEKLKKYSKHPEYVISYLWKIGFSLKRIKERNPNINIKIKTFSDNYLIAVETEETRFINDFALLANIIGGIQADCFCYDNLFIRGAIVKGSIFINDEIVLGEGLLRAYGIESNTAIYPRIIVDSMIGEYFTESLAKRDFTKKVFVDIDNLPCLNSLLFYENVFDESVEVKIKNHLLAQMEEVEASNDIKVVQKINWFKCYIDEFYSQNKTRR